MHATSRPVQTRFRSGSGFIALTSPRTLSRRFMMQKVRNRALPLRAIALSLLVDTRFQVLLTPLTGVLFTFPSRYLFTIGRQGVFRLTRWSSQIQAGLHVSRLTWVHNQEIRFSFGYGTVTLCGPTFQTVHLPKLFSRVIPIVPLNPDWTCVQPV